MSYGPLLANVREYFGFTQADLAYWLNISKSQLARIETGHDPLPRHAWPWFWVWYRAYEQEPEPDPPRVPLPTHLFVLPPAPSPLLVRVHECRYQAELLRQRLAKLEARSRVFRRRLAAAPRVQAALPPATADEPSDAPAVRRRHWLASLLVEATDALHPATPGTGSREQTLLAARRSAWLHEADWLEAHLAAAADAAAGA